MRKIRHRISAAISRHGYRAFAFSLVRGARLLDVGCGNDSPFRVKSQRADVYYIGLDVGDYNQTRPEMANQYVVVSPAAFVAEIGKLAGSLDAVISSHNIEHCNDPQAVILAMASSLKPGGRIYMSFPCEQSVKFPNRRGCLNFFDDPTHQQLPRFDEILSSLRAAGLHIAFAKRRYRPPMLWLLGALLEPVSRLRQRIAPGTWAYWGFESVIWATKI
jgi:2-polyprenyl-3-methyl-5-hydroxy-6-metoxy-1,4-benzoquinol methylase